MEFPLRRHEAGDIVHINKIPMKPVYVFMHSSEVIAHRILYFLENLEKHISADGRQKYL